MLKKSLFLIGCVAMMFSSHVHAVISVNVDRSSISQDESFYLEYSSDRDVDDDPDFSPLDRNFSIASQSTSSNMSIINGRVKREVKWTLMLMAKKSGVILIPSIRFGRDRSPELKIKISPPVKSSGKKGSSPLFIEADTNNKSVYVQSQLLYTVRVYTSINLLNAKLPDPEITSGDAIIEKFDSEASFEKRINGRRYKIFERRYAIFPQKSGTLTIAGTVFNGQYVDSRRALRTKVLRTEPINITVKPKPAVQTIQNNFWLPAEKVQIKEDWPSDPPTFSVGNPVTRTITIVASGLTSSQLPQIQTRASGDMKMYPDKAVLNDNKSTDGIIGIRQEKTAIIPTRPGEFEVAAIEIPWWNTRKDRLEYASIPARKIRVSASAAKQDPGVPQTSAIVPDTMTDETAVDRGTVSSQKVQDYWRWLAIVATAAWLLTFIAWWRKSPGPAVGNKQDTPRAGNNCDAWLKQVKQSCKSNDAVATKDALLLWGKCAFDSQPANLGLLAKCCGGDTGREIQSLGSVLYGRVDKVQWQGDALLNALEAFKLPLQNPALQAKNNGILPLHLSVNRSGAGA